ncbi:hypothetical protein M409DRAFT_24643 [Zasmidium cellare ATCC 36951]|uniref:Transcription factor domain-containing protein n=1 Tax=Zasmidium cellare ATCC 36951 TaxID=1080233 RepID=A0A6A6CGE7_ZASCE|nr:uncharacterized protein M409DRAFT_24643 [Zasmidium cellare ATCC 36951]KAF2165260.1 hypothetical protein M409DRAFT_24643 [Zasmidium cellare ATCC 36951]
MEQPSAGLAFVSYEPGGSKRGGRRAREIRVHAGRVGWAKSSKAAEVEARRKKKLNNRDEDQCDESRDAALLLPRSVAPVFGGVSLKTFDAAEDGISKRISYLMLSAVWPNVAGESVAAPWFVDFCNDSLMFHTHCTAGAMYRDIIAQKSEWSHGKAALTHKAQTLTLIKSKFDNLERLSQEDIERLLLAMGILGVHEFDPKHSEHKPLPFVPFHPAANWISIWGRSDPVEAHVHASLALACRLGGPKALKLPGLGYMAGLTDIFFASCHFRKPIVSECYWDDVHIFDVMPDELRRATLDMTDDLPPVPGSGFADLPGGLPPTALSVFTEVAYIDRILAGPSVRDHPASPVQRARLATCHKLLSLSSWDELDDIYHQDSYEDSLQTGHAGKCHRAIYEICRITCVIYSTACFFSLPPHNGWNKRLTSIALDLLELANFDMWSLDVQGLYLWVLFICGMAAFDTPNRLWFENALANYARKRQVSVEHALEHARRFVWSDSVCDIGARELWNDAMVGKRPTAVCSGMKMSHISDGHVKVETTQL